MAIRATAQYTISEIFEECSAVFSNDTYVFRANVSNVAFAETTSIRVYGYQGNTQVSTNVGTISGLPSAGMTATINNNNSTNTTITIAVTTKLTSSIANSGTLTIPVTVGGKTINKSFGWTKATTGATGATARVYWLSADATTVTRSANKTLTPATITFISYYRDGTKAENKVYNGRFIIQESQNGKDWTTKYTSTKNESKKVYTPTNETNLIKCTMYVAGATSTALDSTIIGVVDSIEGLEIGGRNLILNSKNIIFNESDNGNTGTSENNNNGTTIIPTADGNVYNTKVQVSKELTKGKIYTLSFETISPDNIGFCWYPSESYTRTLAIPASTTWHKTIFTYTQTGEDKGALSNHLLGLNGLIATHIYVIRNIKLEEGNQATSWSPAPEDMTTNDQLNTRIDGLDTKLNKDIDAKVNAATDKIVNEDGIIDQRIKSTKIEINKETGERMRDLEAYTSRMLLTGNKFSVDISKAKGVNLIQNSVMKQHNERGGSGANSKSIKANFWWNNSLQKEGYLPNVYYGEDSISRTYTDSGNYFRFNFQQANNTTLDYIFSNSIDLKLNSSSIILAYKIKGQNLSSNATFFIGLVFYKKDNSASGLGSVSSANGIPTAYYIPLKEYKSKDLDNSFTQDYIYKTLPITREGTTTFEETLEVITNTDTDGSITKYVQLSATPAASSSNKVFILDPDAKKNVEKSASSDGKVYLDSADDRLVITVRYYRDLVNFIPLSNPTAETVATKAAEIGPTEVGIFYNSSTKKIWAYNPFTGTYKETSNLFDNTVTDTNIDSVRVVIGVRASNTTAITGQVDISDLKVEYDNASTIWTQKEGEIYTKQYKMDEKGFSISSDTNTMFIDEQEIAAYKRKDGSTEELDTDNPVFQIKEDETILRQTTVYEQLNIENNSVTRDDAFVMKQQLVNNKWYFIFY